MLNETKKSKVKNWMKDHSFELVTVAAFGSLAAFSLYLAKLQGDEIAKQLTWIDEQEEEGHSVLYDAYGQLYSADVVATYN